MEYDLTHLTFLADPQVYQAQAAEVCAHVPAGVTSAEELIDVLRAGLGLPAYSDNWNVLYDVLRDWSEWLTIPQRVVLVHTDVPLLRSGKLWWVDLKSYLHTLIGSIVSLQASNATEANPLKRRELVVIFPAQMYDELSAVLTRSPDWELRTGLFDEDALNLYELDPSRSTVLQSLQRLDALITEVLTLRCEGVGTLTVQYNKPKDAYYVEYASSDRSARMVAATEAKPALAPAISLAQATQVLETFFTSGERSDVVAWSIVPSGDQFELGALRELWSYHDTEEALLELDASHTLLSAIGEGVYEAVQSGANAFGLEYWKHVLERPEASLVQRVAALCIIGLSNLPEAPALLQPFLRSEVKQERWVSARFAGQWGEEEALPVLLSMLTDELPTVAQEENGYWYEGWRWYVPRLLRRWQTTEVGEQVRSALVTWLQAEPRFDQEIDIWKLSEERICYELGYRGDFAAITDLPLAGEQRKELLEQMERGYKVKRQQMSDEEEYRYLRYGIELQR